MESTGRKFKKDKMVTLQLTQLSFSTTSLFFREAAGIFQNVAVHSAYPIALEMYSCCFAMLVQIHKRPGSTCHQSIVPPSPALLSKAPNALFICPRL